MYSVLLVPVGLELLSDFLYFFIRFFSDSIILLLQISNQLYPRGLENPGTLRYFPGRSLPTQISVIAMTVWDEIFPDVTRQSSIVYFNHTTNNISLNTNSAGLSHTWWFAWSIIHWFARLSLPAVVLHLDDPWVYLWPPTKRCTLLR